MLDEKTAHTYYSIVALCATLSIALSTEQLEALRGRVICEAAKAGNEQDSRALRLIEAVIRVYQEDQI